MAASIGSAGDHPKGGLIEIKEILSAVTLSKPVKNLKSTVSVRIETVSTSGVQPRKVNGPVSTPRRPELAPNGQSLMSCRSVVCLFQFERLRPGETTCVHFTHTISEAAQAKNIPDTNCQQRI
jgi:hypothetical protein